MNDYARIDFLAEHCEHVSISAWLVQLCVNKKWYTAYFKQPPGTEAKIVHETKADALKAVLDEAMAV